MNRFCLMSLGRLRWSKCERECECEGAVWLALVSRLTGWLASWSVQMTEGAGIQLVPAKEWGRAGPVYSLGLMDAAGRRPPVASCRHNRRLVRAFWPDNEAAAARESTPPFGLSPFCCEPLCCLGPR